MYSGCGLATTETLLPYMSTFVDNGTSRFLYWIFSLFLLYQSCFFSEKVGKTLKLNYDIIFLAYFCENWKFFGVHCKTNTATSAATRSPGISKNQFFYKNSLVEFFNPFFLLTLHFVGTIPSVFIIETVMNHVAKVLGKSPDVIREINFYKQGQVKIIIFLNFKMYIVFKQYFTVF